MLPLQLAVVLALVVSCALLVAALQFTRRARLEFESRVNLVAVQPLDKVKEASGPPLSARLGWLNEAARLAFSVGARYRWGMQISGLALLGSATGAASVLWLLAYTFLGHSVWFASLLGLLAFFLVPRRLLLRQQKRAERQFMEQLPGAIDMIIRMLRAGLPVISAVRSVGSEAAPPLNNIFVTIADQVEIGIPFESALDTVSQRIGLPDFRFFSITVTLQHGTGGNLAATLENLADAIRRRRAIRLKAVAATAEVRVSAYVIGGIPIIVIGLLFLLKPDYVAPLFYDPRGKYILGTAVCFLGAGFLTMQRMMRRVGTV